MIQLRLPNEACCEPDIRLEQLLYGAGVVVKDCCNHSRFLSQPASAQGTRQDAYPTDPGKSVLQPRP